MNITYASRLIRFFYRNIILMVLFFTALNSCNKPKFQSRNSNSLNKQKDSKNITAVPEGRNTRVLDVENALNILRIEPFNDRNRDEQIAACKIVGDNRCTEAVPFLLNKLTVIRPVLTSNKGGFAYSHPAGGALISIGDPAIQFIQKNFEKTTCMDDKMLLIDILRRIKGKIWVLDYLEKIGKTHENHDINLLHDWVNGFDS